MTRRSTGLDKTSVNHAGKVNPVVPEVVNQVAFGVVGNEVTISLAAESGQLQLNAFEPIIAHGGHHENDRADRLHDECGRHQSAIQRLQAADLSDLAETDTARASVPVSLTGAYIPANGSG
jgi:fumarate hydratase class II